MKQELSLPLPPVVTPCARLGLLTSAELCFAQEGDQHHLSLAQVKI